MKRALVLLLASTATLWGSHSITNLSPGQRTAGSGAISPLTINGHGFQPANTVTFNGQPVVSQFVNPNQLFADIPPNFLANPGTVQVRVTAGVGDEAFSAFIINPPPQITTPSLPGGTAGASYNQSVAVIQGTPPYAWTFTGQLPSNVSLNSSTGQISGVPNLAGTFNFTINVTDSGGGATSRPYSITISPAGGPPIITTQSLPNGSLGAPYSTQLTATGGAGIINWTLFQGTLPAGLQLSGGGLLLGTPGAVGSFPVVIRATDANNQFDQRSYTIVISSIALQPANSILPNGSVNIPYSQQFSATGANGAVTWTRTQGAFPAGMALNETTGVLSGAPAAGGTFNFTIRATDTANAFGERQYSLSITGGNPPVIVTLALPGGVVGSAYTVVVEATGGTGIRSWSVPPNTLPPGLLLNPANGAITGFPAAPGTFTFTITVTDALQASGSRQFTVSVSQSATRIISSISPSVTTAGAPSFTLTINGSNFSASDIVLFGGQPIAATFVNSTRFLAVAPAALLTQPGIVNVTVFGGPADQPTIGFLINPKPSIQTTSLAGGRVGTPYSQSVAVSGGTGPFRWTVIQGTIPPGLTLNDLTGVISGIPATAGSYPITLAVNDSFQIGASQSFTIIVASPFGSLPDGRAGVLYSSRFVLTGAPAPVVCRTTSSSLPPGLTLAFDCLLSGTPTAEGA
ncbi:MAG: putative Ig domain-containing protein, partial [Bryobacteraceae bacterium]